VDLYLQLIALLQVTFIDLVLAGDNAIIVGMAASRVHPRLRSKVIFWGVAGAVVLRILFASIATQLLSIIGLTLAGGILLLWVCWKMYREITIHKPEPAYAGAGAIGGSNAPQTATFGAALAQIIVADISMSLDNVLAVAGAAKGDIPILVAGLAIAVVFMAFMSAFIAKLLVRYSWITWVGLAIILYISVEMIFSGSYQVGCVLRFLPASACSGSLWSAIGNML
jgi:YjbE family integral membrane protein